MRRLDNRYSMHSCRSGLSGSGVFPKSKSEIENNIRSSRMAIELRICLIVMALSPWFRITYSNRIVIYEPGLFDVQLFLDFDIGTKLARSLMDAFGITVTRTTLAAAFDALKMTGCH